MESNLCDIPAHNIFDFDDGIRFSSNFDNGNLARVERCLSKPYEFRIWTSADCAGQPFQAKNSNAWFHFVVTGLPVSVVLRIQIVNASNHGGLYKHDMRPVFRSNSTNQRWARLRNSVRFARQDDSAQLYFEHTVEVADDKLYFAFTYPYTYSMVLNDLAALEKHQECGSLFCQRELLTFSCDGRRVELVTITSVDGAAHQREPLLAGLFPESSSQSRPPLFPEKEIIFISARVHPGEVPAQHTFKGIYNLLLDKDDFRAHELRRRYVFKLIPMLNPDGVYRGHFRLDQFGENLNRYYVNPTEQQHPSIYAAKQLLDLYAGMGKLAMYLDLHAHASKRGCFIYGNVLPSIDDQVQNQLFCRLIALNSAHFDYEGCLFSREHMSRIDPGDQAKGLTAEGSGRVNTYMTHGLIHSYTLECNYNTSRSGNEVPPTDGDPGGQCVTPASAYTTNPEKYTPSTYAGVGRACIIALLDIRGHNPCSRLPKSKHKSLERLRQVVMTEVRLRKEYRNQLSVTRDRKKVTDANRLTPREADDPSMLWRRVATGTPASESSDTPLGGLATSNNIATLPLTLGVAAGVSAGVGGGRGACDSQKDKKFRCPKIDVPGSKTDLPSLLPDKFRKSTSLSPIRKDVACGDYPSSSSWLDVQNGPSTDCVGIDDHCATSNDSGSGVVKSVSSSSSRRGSIGKKQPAMPQRTLVVVKKGRNLVDINKLLPATAENDSGSGSGSSNNSNREARGGTSKFTEGSDSMIAKSGANGKLPPRPPANARRGSGGGGGGESSGKKPLSKTLQAAGVALMLTKKLRERVSNCEDSDGEHTGSDARATGFEVRDGAQSSRRECAELTKGSMESIGNTKVITKAPGILTPGIGTGNNHGGNSTPISSAPMDEINGLTWNLATLSHTPSNSRVKLRSLMAAAPGGADSGGVALNSTDSFVGGDVGSDGRLPASARTSFDDLMSIRPLHGALTPSSPVHTASAPIQQLSQSTAGRPMSKPGVPLTPQIVQSIASAGISGKTV